ncbi:MAG: translocation/assembly module TamB, partial [Phenylobacterium sp.]
MSGPDDIPAPGLETQVEEVLKGSIIPKVIVATALTVLILIAGLLAATRYGVLLPQARVFIEARTDGLKIGRFGQLKIEGLAGDVWRDFTIRRLTIRDEKGVWLEANDVHLVWRAGELVRRRFHADKIEARLIKVIRRPTLRPKGKDSGLPVSFHIDDAHGRLELTPEFSLRRGVYDLNLELDVERRGGQQGRLRAVSVLHPGDHLNLDFDVSKTKPVLLLADAEEARGGALAGALGLPANQPFSLKVAAGGKLSEGRVSALATSGNTQPLKAMGVWTEDGGQVAGRLSLTASTLTTRWAQRFGPDAVFVLAGRRAGPEFFALDGRVRADNLSMRAYGLGDIGKRKTGPNGLTVAASVASLSRAIGGPQTGSTRVNGVLTGGESNWRFAGAGTVTQLKLGSYGLAQVAGPLEASLQSGVLALKARLTGSGGAGTGWIAAALGAAPKASFDFARLADGRLSLRDLDVTGHGLKAAASGGRGLLGALTFKGQATMANLAAARAGASGSASATWSASQAAAGKPWVFTADARGQKFATGYAELDRLLGQKPALALQATYQNRRVAVGKATLAGAALRASTAGVLASDGGLTFKLDWTADGPFRAGPVEIAGKARGSGAITGTVAQPRADLIADVDQVDLPRLPLQAAHITLSFLRKPDGSSGMVAVTAQSAYGPARGRSDFRFPAGGVDLTGLSVDAGGVKASGALSLRRSAPSAADLDVEITRGAFLDAGRVAGSVRLVDAAGGPRATLNLTGENARLPGSKILLKTGRVTADGPMARLPYAAQAEGISGAERWSFNGRGVLSDIDPGYAATFDGSGKLGARDLRTVETATFRFGGPERSARLRLAATDGGRVDLDGKLTASTSDIRAQVAGLSLGLLDQDLAGTVDATLALQGRDDRLDGTLEAKLAGARG